MLPLLEGVYLISFRQVDVVCNSVCTVFIFLVTSSAVSLTAHSPYGACGLEGTPLRFARSYSLRSWALPFPAPFARKGLTLPLLATLGGGTH